VRRRDKGVVNVGGREFLAGSGELLDVVCGLLVTGDGIE
jgi:hypothetical protein